MAGINNIWPGHQENHTHTLSHTHALTHTQRETTEDRPVLRRAHEALEHLASQTSLAPEGNQLFLVFNQQSLMSLLVSRHFKSKQIKAKLLLKNAATFFFFHFLILPAITAKLYF